MIKLGEVVMILDLHRQGLSVSAIALQLNQPQSLSSSGTRAARPAQVPGPSSAQPRPRRISDSSAATA